MKTKHPILSEQAYKDVAQIMDSGMLSGFRGTLEGHTGGHFVQLLEDEFRAYLGVKHAISLNSATAGLHAACIACGIKEGDEVIVTPYSFVSSASCVKMVGATPVFIDIDPYTFCISPFRIYNAITPKTKAIIPVHLMGHPADMNVIMTAAKYYNLKVIEDAAQSLGATYRGHYTGTIGDCGVFSFNQSKHVSTGEGGMLVTNNDEIARIVRAVRNHGEIADPELGIVGYNYRLTEIEAAIALDQFRNLDRMNDWRIELTTYMSELLSTIPGLTPPVTYPHCKHVFYTYAVKVDPSINRDALQDELIKRGIYFGKGYVKPLYYLPIFGGKGNLPVVEEMWRTLMVTDIFRYPVKKDYVKTCYNNIRDIISNLGKPI